MGRSPIFLERDSYRRRRLTDAVRILPMLGLALWMVPLMWSVNQGDVQGEAMPMSAALRYVFGIWVCMVLAGWALWRGTPQRSEPEPPG